MGSLYASRPVRLAIQQDEVVFPDGHRQSFAERWTDLAVSAGHEVRHVDVFSDSFFDDLAPCDGFMWRFGFPPVPRLVAKRIIPALEHGQGLPVFPDTNTIWHFEDKIAQYYLLSAMAVPQPRTRVLWNHGQALKHCEITKLPFVLKLAHGFQSTNVRLVQSRAEARAWADELFGPGLASFNASPAQWRGRYGRRARAAIRLLLGLRARGGADFSHGYMYVQEFLPGNGFDTRITVIGDRAFGFRRFNRDEDFRASGSGRIDWNPAEIAEGAIELGFSIARRLGTQAVALDVLKRGEEFVVGEISYTGASWAIAECPGHWRRLDAGRDDRLAWIEGKVRPEDAIFEDFVKNLSAKRRPRDH